MTIQDPSKGESVPPGSLIPGTLNLKTLEVVNYTSRQNLEMSGNTITNVAEPTKDNDGATKLYVDNKLGSALPILNDGNVFIGNVSGDPISTTITGDLELSNTGVLSVKDGSITTSKILDGSITSSKLTNTGVIAGVYNPANLTVNQKGLITSASLGTPLPSSAISVKRTTAIPSFFTSSVKEKTIPFEVINFNTGSDVSVNIPGAGDTFTILEDGLYDVTCSVAFSLQENPLYLSVSVSGNPLYTTPIIIGSTGVDGLNTFHNKHCNGSILLKLDAGDTVQFIGNFVLSSGTTPSDIAGLEITIPSFTTSNTWATIERV